MEYIVYFDESYYPYNSSLPQSPVPFDSSHNTHQQPYVVSGRKHHVFRHWIWETLSLIVALGLIAAIFSILAHFDSHILPNWPFSININTLIALLSTIMRAAMLVAVASILGQVKWTWFSQTRTLNRMQDFDSASRSILGSIKLLWVAPGSFLGVLAALTTILSLAVGPFTQQAIKTISCPQPVDDTNGSLPIAHFVPASGGYYRIAAGLWEVEVDMKGAMINGIVNPTGNDSAIVATCPTGNCTFPVHNGITHSSIGMCSSCIDTTSLVVGRESTLVEGLNGTTNFTLPNGMWVSPLSDMVYLNAAADDLDWASSLFDSDFAEVAHSALVNTTVLTLSTAPCSNDTKTGVLTCPHNITSGYSTRGHIDYVATSCAMYPCLKNYNATMEGGVLIEDIVSTQVAPANWVEANGSADGFTGAASNFTALKTPCQVDDAWYDLSNLSSIPQIPGRDFVGINVNGTNYTAPNECLYKMLWLYGEALYSFIGTDLFDGQCTYDSRQGEKLLCNDAWWLAPLYNNQRADFGTLNTAVQRFTTALTNKLRTTGTDSAGNVGEVVKGRVFETTVCTSFDWRWLLMPLLLVVITAAMMIVMVGQNLMDKRQPVWKSSLLPALFYGPGLEPRGAQPAMDLDELASQAAGTKVRFRNGEGAGFEIHPSQQRMERDIDMDSLVGER
ncbi:hypothetical protein F5Y15DRAFT_408460 [Xylariaceae sp. FL0016]|nr:hypothetical protein F5Y15DRAFT_408460 [Xylariaceae sp. FL0016]